MKKILLSLGVIGAFILYSLQQQNETSKVHVVSPFQSSSPIPISTYNPNSSPSPTIVSQKSSYKDGTYTGDITDAFYGPYQVQAVIIGGKITDINFLQYPNDRGNSIAINTQSMPYLKQEAIQSQNAQVNIVTGATQSSLAFQKSLQSALDKAH
jgi:uncharacterized protein with FMN-binding domain